MCCQYVTVSGCGTKNVGIFSVEKEKKIILKKLTNKKTKQKNPNKNQKNKNTKKKMKRKGKKARKNTNDNE